MTLAARRISTSIVALTFGASLAIAEPAVDHIAPNSDLTPGAVISTDMAQVCRPGYAENHGRISSRLKAEIYQRYGIDKAAQHHEIDRLIPLSLGGSDELGNLWPQSLKTKPWNAVAKNRLALRLHDMVCAGELPLAQAQKEIAEDWIAAYETYIGALDNVHGGQ